LETEINSISISKTDLFLPFPVISNSQKLPTFQGQTIIGKKVRVFWDLEQLYFEGTVTDFNEQKKDYQIHYDDGQILWNHILKDLEFLEYPKSSSNKHAHSQKLDSHQNMFSTSSPKNRPLQKNSTILTKQQVEKKELFLSEFLLFSESIFTIFCTRIHIVFENFLLMIILRNFLTTKIYTKTFF